MTSDEIAYMYVVLITLLARVVVKYCDSTTVCLFACLSARMSLDSGTTCAIFTSFSVHLAYSRSSVFLQQGNEIPKEGAFLGVFSPLYYFVSDCICMHV